MSMMLQLMEIILKIYRALDQLHLDIVEKVIVFPRATTTIPNKIAFNFIPS